MINDFHLLKLQIFSKKTQKKYFHPTYTRIMVEFTMQSNWFLIFLYLISFDRQKSVKVAKYFAPLIFISSIVPNALFPHPFEWFQEVEKGYIGKKWVNTAFVTLKMFKVSESTNALRIFESKPAVFMQCIFLVEQDLLNFFETVYSIFRYIYT